jgi:hypothetical protein
MQGYFKRFGMMHGPIQTRRTLKFGAHDCSQMIPSNSGAPEA